MITSRILRPAAVAAMFLLSASCEAPVDEAAEKLKAEHARVAENIAMYTQVWDDIINKAELDLFNEDNFTNDVLIHAEPENLEGIEAVREYYANYTTGFSNIEFTIEDVFGQGDKIVKHWRFKGTHTGDFFGIPATEKEVDLEGVTLVRMEDGKIAEERDFFDNYSFLMQLGLIPAGE